MGKAARHRAGRDRDLLIDRREKKRLRFWTSKLAKAVDSSADDFVRDMRKAREEVPGATQEIPKVAYYGKVRGLTVGNGQCDLDIRELTRDELRALAAEHDIKGRGSMNKEELIKAIEEAA